MVADQGMTEVVGEKRKYVESTEGTAKDEAEQVVAAGLPQAPQLKNEDFNPELLRVYYERLFPFLGMYRWLRYGNDPKSSTPGVEKDYFLRREFTFVLQGDIFCRYLCFRDMEEFKQQVLSRQPIRMEIGAVYSHPPKNHTTIVKSAYKPLERELVFDIDMDDYDDIRTCCKGATICCKCWTFMRIAMRTLSRVLREEFGFQHLMFVYSGRRGMHCWVGDVAARKLSNEYRSAVADYVSLVVGGENRARTEIRLNGCDEVHPSVEKAHEICERFFKDDPRGVLRGQEILKNGPHLANILNQLEPEKDAIKKYVAEHPDASSSAIWAEIERLVALRVTSTYKERQEAKVVLKEIVLHFTYPRLDVNVSKQMNHLLKSPFVVHPKTGRVCVPIDPATMDSFDPSQVPTVGRLIEEMNRSGDPRETSLKAYTHWFEQNFVVPLEKEAHISRGDALDF